MNTPKPPSGMGPTANWLKQLLAAVRGYRILPGPNYRIRQYGNGIVLDIAAGGAAAGGGIRWKGEYVTNLPYSKNDLVMVSATLSPTDPAYVAGTNYTGIWLCIQANPVLPSTGTNVRPTYPYPINGDGTLNITWILISLGMREINVSDAQSGKKAFFGAGDPFVPTGS